jgi:hypothetical protein
MNALNPVQSNVEPLIASMWGAKIAFGKLIGQTMPCPMSVVGGQLSEFWGTSTKSRLADVATELIELTN